ncbi:DOMON domain-containing protein [Endogone sp. FLAS-F59071]|nr:DOMON domain-containing protein [Endogone sp. FLAS-F59071]|eukprot:RUS14543.1 DOMON domain-containing protein [Endogone sp. FLAS-F59071]
MRLRKTNQPNMLALAVLLVLVACAITTNAITVQSTTPASATLPINLSSYSGNSSFIGGAYNLYWRVDTSASMIYLALDVSTSGWVGFGIADPANGGMRGADIVTLFVTSNTTHTVTSLTDRYALEHALPNEDTCNQWTVSAGWQSGNRTVVAFQRALSTGDTQDRAITAGEVKVVMAYSADGTNQIAYHGQNRQAYAVTFFEDASSTVAPVVPQESVVVWNYTNPPTVIAAVQTKYVCTELPRLFLELSPICILTGFLFRPAPGNLTGQIIEIAPVIDPATASYVHHYLVYACQNNTKFQVMFNNPTECLTDSYNILDICPMAYAPGSGALTFPANVGLPFGDTSDPFDTTFLALEVHYNNPDTLHTPNISDISGLSISYITKKRQHDAGLLALGDPYVLGAFMPFGSSRVEREV